MRHRDDPRPNILVLMTDQWRFDWVGYLGADFVPTPNIDRLAARGRVFTHCCTNSPVCAPARISLACGLDPERVGALDNQAYLPRRCTTYYQRLRDAGYEVGCVGKLDLAKPDRYNGIHGRRPATFRWGFTDPLEVEGKMHAAQRVGDGSPHGPYSQWLHEQGLLEAFREHGGGFDETSVLPEHAFCDSYIGQRAKEWIERRTGEFPWQLFVSFVGPHDPFDPPERLSRKHADAPVPEAARADLSDRPEAMQRRDRGLDAERVRHARRQYLGSIEAIDIQVGEILQALEASGEAERTYIVFSSDHGEMLGDLGMWTKSVPYDPAVRVPLAVVGPDVAVGRSDALISLFDLGATCGEWAGLPPQEDVDARSFAACARGERDQHRDVCLATIQGFRLLRDHDHLYVEHRCGGREFYDLRADPHATRNRAAEVDLAAWRSRLNQRCLQGGGLR